MVKDTYIHGIGSAEQERLTLLNRLTNQSFIDFLALTDTRSILDIGSGLGILTEQVAELAPHSTVCGIEYFAEQLAATKARRRPNLHLLLQVLREMLILTDFVGSVGAKIKGMEVPKSSKMWSDEQHSFGAAAPIPWPQAYLLAVRE